MHAAPALHSFIHSTLIKLILSDRLSYIPPSVCMYICMYVMYSYRYVGGQVV